MPSRARAQLRCVILPALALTVIACGDDDHKPVVKYGYSLEVSGGTYNDGSGRLGLAVLGTLRDDSGKGPDASWAVDVSGPDGLIVQDAYPAGAGSGSYATWLWPDVAPSPGTYALAVEDGERNIQESFGVGDGAGLEVPVASLSPDGSSIVWAPVNGAATYACQAFGTDGSLELSTASASPGCDVSALPPGAYMASVLAYSADLAALGGDGEQSPRLPARFDVSEARLGFSVPEPGLPQFTVAAAGGALDYGSGTLGLAFWMSIAEPDGTPSAVDWTIEVVGPGLPPSVPLVETYFASFPRQLFWSYDVPATPGTYSYTATSTAGTLAGAFTVGSPAALPLPQGLAASGASQGSATVTWEAVAGARSYLASVYEDGALVTSAWVNGTSITFPAGLFTAGVAYDAYVDATDADMVGGEPPSQVAVSEDAYQPASFVAF